MNDTNNNKLVIPHWLVGILVTLVLTVFGQIGVAVYYAGRFAAQQESQERQLRELRSEISNMREQIERLSNQRYRERYGYDRDRENDRR